MHVCHVTPHLPPDQAANALLPHHLGHWAVERGVRVSYVSHPPRAGRTVPLAGEVTWVATPRRTRAVARWLRLDSLTSARRMLRVLTSALASADLVHVHSNGLLAEMAGIAARRLGKPLVLTLYGTEIWHYRRKWPLDLFTALYRHATEVTFYSRGLLDRARELGLDRPRLGVLYPPVADSFAWHDAADAKAMRATLRIQEEHLLLNVKRVHPLAGQVHLIDAMPAVLDARPSTRLVICGTGPLMDELQARARRHGVSAHVQFAGLVDNADVARYCAAASVFVLPSLLEACPTVAVEALASGTPVVTADHPGGVELGQLFGTDVVVVPRRDSAALAHAIVGMLGTTRRTSPATADTLHELFRPAAVARRYWDVYDRALS